MRLRRRSEFLAVARGLRVPRPAFVLQARRCDDPDRADIAGIGLTVTKKIGSSVVRNRARRRLREALRQVLPTACLPGHDYVVIARPPSLDQAFVGLAADLAGAFAQAGRKLRRSDP